VKPRVTPPLALHQRIRSELESKILSGEWAPGFRIPYEHELMAQYGCARMTVSKVIAGLVVAGLIERRRRAGSFVAQPRIQSAVMHIPDIQAEIASRGEEYGYELRARRQRAASGHDPIGSALTAGAQVIDLKCRHSANSQPFALEERLINLDAVPEAARVDFQAVPPGTWLLGHVPWTEAEHRITAVSATTREAKALGVPKGAACLSVERRTWRAAETITFVRQLFRGDLYHLIARFAPQG
jgi:GntR family transcriptional regulator, histidine utilization repressor